MPADPLAQQDRQASVPVGQYQVQRGAGAPAGPGDDQYAEGFLQLAAGPRRHRVRMAARHAQHGGQVGTVQVVPQVQLDDLAVRRVQPGDGGPYQCAQLGSPGRLTDIIAGREVLGLLDLGRRLPGPELAVAFVTRHRVQPRAQLARVTQPVQPGGGDDERVLHRVGGVGRLTQHSPAVAVQGRRVPIVDVGEACLVSRHDGGDSLAVVHANTVIRLSGLGTDCYENDQVYTRG